PQHSIRSSSGRPLGKLAFPMECWELMSRRKRGEVHATVVEQGIGRERDCIDAIVCEGCKDSVNVPIGTRPKYFDLPSGGRSCRARVGCRGLSTKAIGGVDQYGKPCGLWQKLLQEPKPLWHKLDAHRGDTSDIAARPIEAGDKAGS